MESKVDVISFMELIKREMEGNVYDFTVNGKCSGCGACCSNLLPMSEKEIRTIRKYIKKNGIKECKHRIPFKKTSYDMTCPFLDTDKSCNKCRIYEVRPMICRKFVCDNAQIANMTKREANQTRRCIDVRDTFFGGTDAET